MVFYQELCLLWASTELFMAMTHLFVFLGFRNSKLGFIRRQKNYFLFDATCHLINILLYSPKTVGLPIYLLWIYAVIVHLYYVRNLMVNPPPKRLSDGQMEDDNSHKISRIFHWSCVDFQDDRFNIFKSGRQMAETTIDVTLHTVGFMLAFRNIQSIWYKLTAVLLMIGLFYRQMLALKYFLTDPKMMPKQLQRFFTDKSAETTTN